MPRWGKVGKQNIEDAGPLTRSGWRPATHGAACKGTMQVWAEPFTRLRLPKVYNLQTDPYEVADVTNSYYEWMI